MKRLAIIYAFALALIAFGQTAWAQNYITDVLVIGDPTQSEASDRYDSFVSQGWTGINHNLNSGTDDGYYIYLLYKTDVSPYSSGTPITDLYLRVSDSNDGPNEFTLDGRTYQLSYHFGHPNFTNSKGDLNCGASGEYIHLYYTKDAFPIGRVVTSIAIDNTYHSGTHPNTIFTSDQNSNVSLDIDSQEGQIDLFYIERDWEEDLSITSTTRMLAAGQYTVLNGGGDVHLNSGFYVVKGNVTYGFIYMEDGGEHHLILCDGAILNAKHINVEGNNKLFIYGQIKDLGQAIVKDKDGDIPHAGIGGRGVETGTIVIHGGYVQAQGGNEAHLTYSYGGAGIGGARYGKGGTINILGGTVVAWASGDGAAGIGGGYDGNGADVAIRGGRVIAEGYIYGPGIGAGYNATDIIE